MSEQRPAGHLSGSGRRMSKEVSEFVPAAPRETWLSFHKPGFRLLNSRAVRQGACVALATETV